MCRRLRYDILRSVRRLPDRCPLGGRPIDILEYSMNEFGNWWYDYYRIVPVEFIRNPFPGWNDCFGIRCVISPGTKHEHETMLGFSRDCLDIFPETLWAVRRILKTARVGKR